MFNIRTQRFRELCSRLTNFCKLDRPKDERPRFRFCFLPRKEVIQPHLPIRLPCYDFTPVIDLAFDGFLHEWLEYRLRALPTPMV